MPHPTDAAARPRSIFLSFSGTDREAARRVKQRLQQALDAANEPVRIWFDETGIGWGDNWVKTLQEAIAGCSAYIILWGAAGDRRWVAAELAFALRRHFEAQLPVFPLLLPGSGPDDLPPFLGIFQARPVSDATDFAALADTLLRATASTPGEAHPFDPTRCPFPGLEAFQEDQREFFYGRQTETVEALRLLGEGLDGVYRRWLLIEGPSGVGKSSLLRAGICPAIRSGWMQRGGGRDRWLITPPMRPGDRPLRNLAEAIQKALAGAGRLLTLPDVVQRLAGSPGSPDDLALLLREQVPADAVLLLVVDQLEEMFTLVQDAQEKARTDALLAEALNDHGCPLRLIATIRSDFLLRFDELPQLNQGINQQVGRYYLRPVDEAGLRDIVYTPARLAGLQWSEPSLPGRIVEDALKAGKAALPLLGNLLRLLWDAKEGNTLNEAVYRNRLGGVGGALARSADATLTRIAAEDKQGPERARRLLLALVNVGRDGPDTRRTLPLSVAIDALGGSKWQWVLDRLSGLAGAADPGTSGLPRLVLVHDGIGSTDIATTLAKARNEPQVEIAHEALLGRSAEGKPYWPTLTEWVMQERRNLEQRDLLESLARDWQAKGSPGFSGLLSGRQLREFKGVTGARPPAPEYVRRSRRVLWMARGSLAVVAGAFAGAALFVQSVVTSDLWKTSPKAGLATFREIIAAHGLAPIPPRLVEIPAGRFQMGSPEGEGTDDERPQHEVVIDHPFWIGAYEVSFEEWDRFALAAWARWPEDQGWGRGNRPVINVSWADAKAYTEWVSKETGVACELPSEAQWEYATRAGTTTAYWWGNEVGKGNANCNGCGSQWDNQQTAPVDSFDPNPRGLYNVHGNVLEWVQDCPVRYKNAPSDGSPAACGDRSSARVLRGGSWVLNPVSARAADRNRFTPGYRDDFVGFRVVCSAPIR